MDIKEIAVAANFLTTEKFFLLFSPEQRMQLCDNFFYPPKVTTFKFFSSSKKNIFDWSKNFDRLQQKKRILPSWTWPMRYCSPFGDFIDKLERWCTKLKGRINSHKNTHEFSAFVSFFSLPMKTLGREKLFFLASLASFSSGPCSVLFQPGTKWQSGNTWRARKSLSILFATLLCSKAHAH